MANHQLNQQYGKYFGYGSGTQYDSSTAQNKWGSAANTGNQTQLSQTQSQYQAAPQSYGTAATGTATGSGYGYGNVYGQQQNYTATATGTGSSDSSVSNSTFTGNKSTSSFNNANSTSATQSTGFGSSTVTGIGMGMNSYQTNFVSAGFNNNTTANLNASNQVSGMGYGSTTPNMFGSNQDTSMNSTMTTIAGTGSNVTNTLTSNMTNNAVTAATNQVPNYGNTTGDAMNQFNQMNQMFGNATNFGASGDAASTTGVNYSSGFNEGFNSGMMTLLQQSLLQQANSGSGYGNFGTATGNAWGTSDGSGGYYAPPMDSSTTNTTSTTAGSGTGTKQWNNNKGKKWSGKDNKQDFYGNRFSQMYTGVPGVWGQAQTGAGRGKRLMDGVRVNAKGEKVISVEIPLHLYSRWGQLRKIFSRQDTEVAKHLIESHDQKCEEKECVARDNGKNLKKKNKQPQDTEKAETGHEAEEVEMTEEDLMLQQIMGFGNFNTPKEAMEKSKKGGATATACVSDSDTTVKSAASGSWELTAGFIGPQTTEKQEKKPEKKLSDPDSQSGAGALSKEEKEAMAKLGWSVFNNKKNSKGGENDDDDDDDNDDNDDDEGKMDDGDKGAAAAK